MNRTLLALSVGALILGSAAVVLALRARDEAESVRTAPKPKDPTLDRVEGQVRGLLDEVAALRREQQESSGRAAELEKALAAARKTLAEHAAAIAAVQSGAAAAPTRPETTGDPAAEAARQAAAVKEEFDALRRKIYAGEGTAEDQARFWELARTTGLLAQVIDELMKKVESAPADSAARMQLAEAYIAKLLTVPEGPERGAWAMKAEEQWKKVLEQQPEHWDARYSLAFSWSQWPDFLNKTPDAIREFEILRAQQARSAPDPDRSGTYLQLAVLYRKVGNLEKAKEVLQEGLLRNPDNEGLKKALESGGK